jgi:hypothetical protein
MNKQLKFSMFAVVGATIGLGLLAVSQLTLAAPAAYLPEQAVVASPGLPTLNPINKAGEVVHILPTRKLAADLAAASAAVGFADNGPLLYHAGGKIMPSVISYIIYWTPPKLQTGAVAGWSAAYQNLQTRFLTDYQGHSLANNNTQYYQTISGVTSYIHDTGGVSGVYVDTAAYPASGCSDSITPGNCLSDAQIQAEIKKVMALKGWTPGMNKIFFVYTTKGEGSCYGASCSYTQFCAYHGNFGSVATPTIYANMPYAASPYCTASTSPNGNVEADSGASITSHELIEAVTDPMLNAWFTAQGNEIGDLCAWNYGTNTWGALANQKWNGHLYELQQEYDNHAAAVFGALKGCVQVGP